MPAGKLANSDTTSQKRRALLEVSVGYGLILVAIWTPLPWQRMAAWAGLAWVLFATLKSGESWRALGLGIAGFRRSLWIVGVALVLATTAVLLAGKIHIRPLPDFLMMLFGRYWTYGLWAVLQQFILLDFILLRLLKLLPGKKAAITTAAGLFAVAHLPNPVLLPLTLIWGVIACLLFLQYRNLYTVALVHIVFGICVAITVPGPIDHNMRVGLSYLTYRPPHHHYLSQNDHTVSTQAWVTDAAPTLRSSRHARP
jgi:membrane protease YdiL (CAAX protease family)